MGIQTFWFKELHLELTKLSASNLLNLKMFRFSSSLGPDSLELAFTGVPPLDRDDILEAISLSKRRSKERESRAGIR